MQNQVIEDFKNPDVCYAYFINRKEKYAHLESINKVYFPLLFTIMAVVIAIFSASHPLLSVVYNKLINSVIKLSINTYSISMCSKNIVNDFLLPIFYFTVGLDLKNKLMQYSGNYKNFIPTISATLGGYIIASASYMYLTKNDATSISYCSIVMLTDTALILNLLNYFSNRLSCQIVLFTILLTIFDDILGSILIVIYKTNSVNYVYLLVSMLVLSLIAVYRKINGFYIMLNMSLIYLFHKAGIHGTASALCIAILAPINVQQIEVLNKIVLKTLHSLNNIIIIPTYIFFNLGIKINFKFFQDLMSIPNLYGIIVAALIGKPIGIVLFGYFGGSRFLSLTLKELVISGYFCSIGLTTSLLIASMIMHPSQLMNMKIVILLSSLLSITILVILISRNNNIHKNSFIYR